MKKQYCVKHLKKSNISGTHPERKDFLIEAYKKHSAELASIEDRMNKFLLVVLAIFGAAATAIRATPLTLGPATFLVGLVLALTFAGVHYCQEIQDLRAATRHLLVRCEIAMDFYTRDDFLHDETLYTDQELEYANKGQFLKSTPIIFIVSTGIALFILICIRFWGGPLPHAAVSFSYLLI